MKIDFKRLNELLEAKASRAIDRLDGLKSYTDEFADTLDSIVYMLEVSKELEDYDTECPHCKKAKNEMAEPNGQQSLVGMPYHPFNGKQQNPNRVVLFYSDNCRPCQFLKPILTKLLEEKNIELELVLVDTPEGENHARDHHVENWPTIFILNNHTVVHTILGANLNAPVEVEFRRLEREIGMYL